MIDLLLDRVLFLIPLVLSLSVHEWAHAYAAFRLGDDTAHRLGRMTLDPTAHIDVLGTIVLPMIGIPFGWAKPVPINPLRFRGVTMRTGIALTAAAGPASNLVLALLVGGSWQLALLLEAPSRMTDLLWLAMVLNVALAVFNMLPISPLDGSRIVEGLLATSQRERWRALNTAGPYVLLFLFVVLMAVTGVRL